MKLFSRLWMDEAGFIVSSELILLATIVVLGLIAGLTTVRDQVVQELGDVAEAIAQVNQSYSFSAVTAHTSSTAGSLFLDTEDFCDTVNQTAGNEPECIDLTVGATDESG